MNGTKPFVIFRLNYDCITEILQELLWPSWFIQDPSVPTQLHVMRIYNTYLLLWDMCCRVYPSLPLHLTARPVFELLSGSYISRGPKDQEQYGMTVSFGIRHQHLWSLRNLFYVGVTQMCPNPSIGHGDDEYARWVAECDKVRSEEFPRDNFLKHTISWPTVEKQKIADPNMPMTLSPNRRKFFFEDVVVIDDEKEGTNEAKMTEVDKEANNVVADEGDTKTKAKKNKKRRKKKVPSPEKSIPDVNVSAHCSVGDLSPLFLSMFIAKGYTSFDSTSTYGGITHNNPATLPLLFTQPRCNHRDYTVEQLREKVRYIMDSNLKGPKADFFQQQAIYCMLYEIQLGERLLDLNDDDILYLRPAMECLKDTESSPTTNANFSRATAAKKSSLQKLAVAFGLPFEGHMADDGKLDDSTLNQISEIINGLPQQETFDAGRSDRVSSFLKTRATNCWKFSYLLKNICALFNGLSTLTDIFRFRSKLIRALCIPEIQPPSTVPELLEECRTYLHALTPLRVGVIEGLGRMLAVFYHSRFLYPETGLVALYQRYLGKKELIQNHVLPEERIGMDRRECGHYLKAITVQSLKVIIHNPAVLSKADRKGYSTLDMIEQDVQYMALLSNIHQNSAALVESTSLAQLLKNYFRFIKDRHNQDVGEYILNPTGNKEDVDPTPTGKNNKTKKGLTSKRDNNSNWYRLDHFVQYLIENPPKALETWIIDTQKNTHGIDWRALDFSSGQKKKYGLQDKNIDDARYCLMLLFTKLVGRKQNHGCGPYSATYKREPNHGTWSGYRMMAPVGLCLDFWYDNHTLERLIAMISNNGVAPKDGSDFLLQHSQHGLLHKSIGQDGELLYPLPANYDIFDVHIDPDRSVNNIGMETMKLFPTSIDTNHYTKENLEMTEYVYFNQLQKPSLALHRCILHEWKFYYCIDAEKKIATKNASMAPKWWPEVEYKFFVNISTEIVHIVSEFGLQLPYWSESVETLVRERSQAPERKTKEEKENEKNNPGTKDTTTRERGRVKELTGIKLALSPNRWQKHVTIKDPHKGANVQGVIGLIVFLVARHRDILRLSEKTFENVDKSGLRTTSDGQILDRPEQWPVYFDFFESKDDCLTLFEVVMVILTNKRRAAEDSGFLTQAQMKRVLNALDGFTDQWYQLLLTKPRDVGDSDPFGRTPVKSFSAWGDLKEDDDLVAAMFEPPAEPPAGTPAPPVTAPVPDTGGTGNQTNLSASDAATVPEPSGDQAAASNGAATVSASASSSAPAQRTSDTPASSKESPGSSEAQATSKAKEQTGTVATNKEKDEAYEESRRKRIQTLKDKWPIQIPTRRSSIDLNPPTGPTFNFKMWREGDPKEAGLSPPNVIHVDECISTLIQSTNTKHFYMWLNPPRNKDVKKRSVDDIHEELVSYFLDEQDDENGCEWTDIPDAAMSVLLEALFDLAEWKLFVLAKPNRGNNVLVLQREADSALTEPWVRPFVSTILAEYHARVNLRSTSLLAGVQMARSKMRGNPSQKFVCEKILGCETKVSVAEEKEFMRTAILDTTINTFQRLYSRTVKLAEEHQDKALTEDDNPSHELQLSQNPDDDLDGFVNYDEFEDKPLTTLLYDSILAGVFPAVNFGEVSGSVWFGSHKDPKGLVIPRRSFLTGRLPHFNEYLFQFYDRVYNALGFDEQLKAKYLLIENLKLAQVDHDDSEQHDESGTLTSPESRKRPAEDPLPGSTGRKLRSSGPPESFK